MVVYSLKNLLVDNLDVDSASISELKNLVEVAKIRFGPFDDSKEDICRAKVQELRNLIKSWEPGELDRLAGRSITNAANRTNLFLSEDQRVIYSSVGIEDHIYETGDELMLQGLKVTHSLKLKLTVLYNNRKDSSHLRSKQIEIAYLEYVDSEKEKEVHLERLKQKQLLLEQSARNTILHSMLIKTDACAKTSSKSLEVTMLPQENKVALTPQDQLEAASEAVNAADHILKLVEFENNLDKPKLTMNQRIAVDYLKAMRERNLVTFDRVLKMVRLHSDCGCKVTKSGQLVHSGRCSDPSSDAIEMSRLFRLAMAEIQPALRHAMEALFSRRLRNPSVDYKFVMTRTNADIYRSKRNKSIATQSHSSEN